MKNLANHIQESLQINESSSNTKPKDAPKTIQIVKRIWLNADAKNHEDMFWTSKKPNNDNGSCEIGEHYTFSEVYNGDGLNYKLTASINDKYSNGPEFLQSDIDNLLKEKAIEVTY